MHADYHVTLESDKHLFKPFHLALLHAAIHLDAVDSGLLEGATHLSCQAVAAPFESVQYCQHHRRLSAGRIAPATHIKDGFCSCKDGTCAVHVTDGQACILNGA